MTLCRRDVLRLLGAGAVAASCAAAPEGRRADPTAAAPPPAVPVASVAPRARLTAYTALDEPTSEALARGFAEAHPGARVALLPIATAAEIRIRVRAERTGPQADLVLGGPSEVHEQLARDGVTEPYRAPGGDLPAAFAAAADAWTAWSITPLGVALHTGRLERELAGRAPEAWDDLLAPSWRERLVIADPASSDLGYLMLVTQVLRFGRDEDRAFDWLGRLLGNAPVVSPTAAGALATVASGAAAGGLLLASDALVARDGGAPLAVSVPRQTGYELGAVSILAGTSEPGLAREFVAWLVTPEAATLTARFAHRAPVRGSSGAPAGAPAASELVPWDRAWAAASRERLVRRWRTAAGPSASR